MMGRANLCDAEFCNKAAAGNADDIRPCIGCLRCLNGIMFGKRISCTVNPDVERDEAGYEPAAEAKNVLVVGAGPAGMEQPTLPPSAATTWCSWTSRMSRAAKCASQPFRRQSRNSPA